MNKKEFFEWLDDAVEGEPRRFYDSNGEMLFEYGLFNGPDFSFVPGSISFRVVDSYECEEGDWAGEEYVVLHCVTELSQSFYIKLWGIYSSYNGTDYKGWKEVSPKTVTKVVYE